MPKAKILSFGASGVGKTVHALKMPAPVLVIDTEKGTEQYGNFSDFYVMRTRNLETTKQILAELYSNNYIIPKYDDNDKQIGEVKLESVVIDSGSTIYDLVKSRYAKYYRKDDPFYNLEGADWAIIKSDFKGNYIYPLLALDLHVDFICREAKNYLEGTYMKINLDDPYKPDIEPTVPYDFDVILHLQKNNGIYQCEVKKSRLLNEKGEQALPEVIKDIDKETFMPWIIDLATRKKSIERDKPIEVRSKNVVAKKADEKLDNIKAEIREILIGKKWSNEEVQNSLMETVGVKSILTKDFTLEKAEQYLAYLQTLIEQQDTVDQEDVS